MINRSLPYLLAFITFLLHPLSASVIHDRDVDDLEFRLRAVSIAGSSQVAHDEMLPFDWQNSKHFEAVTRRFEQIAERELPHIIMQLMRAIESHDAFFDNRYQNLLDMNKTRVVGWMNENVLTESNFDKDNEPFICAEQCESETSDDDENPRDAAFRRGYERESDSDSESGSHSGSDSDTGSGSDDEYFRGRDSDQNYGDFDYDDYDIDDPYEDERRRRIYNENFEAWKIREIEDVLGLCLDHSADLSEDDIDIPQIKRFLGHVNFGRTRGYSWLLNEDVEGSLLTSEDFADLVYKKMSVDKKILANLLGGLWFDFDWEEFDIADPRFIQKTYIKTLNDLLQGTRAKDVKKYMIKRIKGLFIFHGDDFDAPFNAIPERFNGFVREKKWLHAMIEWSIYSTYRKVFAAPAKRSKVTTLETAQLAMPVIHAFNRETYLTTRISKALRRAQKHYTKVYPHEETSKIVFGLPCQGRAELNMAQELQMLKRIGRMYDAARPRSVDAANVFVPMLYFITARGAMDRSGGDHPKHFVRVPLVLTSEKRAVTRKETDLVFKGDHANDNYYFSQAEKDVVRGKVLQGAVSKEEATQKISEIIQKVGVNRDSLLVHSERVLIEALRDTNYVKMIVDTLAQQMGAGRHSVYGAVMLAYSTNTVCPNCTPSLVALQNSGEEKGGFLNLLVRHLVGQGFNVSGYDPLEGSMDWRQFCLNTVVTASINFDTQAHHLTEEGQFLNKKVSKPSKDHHNPHAKLFFPNNEIDVAPLVEEGERAPITYFYEFVGKDMHVPPHANDNRAHIAEHQGTVFASGSKSWVVKPA